MLAKLIDEVVNHPYGVLNKVPCIKINPQVLDIVIEQAGYPIDRDKASVLGIKLQETDEVKSWKIEY